MHAELVRINEVQCLGHGNEHLIINPLRYTLQNAAINSVTKNLLYNFTILPLCFYARDPESTSLQRKCQDIVEGDCVPQEAFMMSNMEAANAKTLEATCLTMLHLLSHPLCDCLIILLLYISLSKLHPGKVNLSFAPQSRMHEGMYSLAVKSSWRPGYIGSILPICRAIP